METVRVSVVQDSPVVFEREATVDKVRHLTGRAAEEGSTLRAVPRGVCIGLS